jgi:hypothetical protein
LTQYGDENSEFVDEARNEIQSLSLHWKWFLLDEWFQLIRILSFNLLLNIKKCPKIVIVKLFFKKTSNTIEFFHFRRKENDFKQIISLLFDPTNLKEFDLRRLFEIIYNKDQNSSITYLKDSQNKKQLIFLH